MAIDLRSTDSVFGTTQGQSSEIAFDPSQYSIGIRGCPDYLKSLKALFSCSWTKGEPLENVFKLHLTIGFSIIGSLFLLVNVVLKLMSEEWMVLSILLGFTAFLAGINTYFYKTRSIEHYHKLCTIFYFAFAIFVVARETESKSGMLLWFFLFPTIIGSVRKTITGKVISFLILALIVFVFFDNWLFNVLPTSYDYEYSLQFITVYLTTMFFSLLSISVKENLEKRLKEMNTNLKHMAYTDPLTGISNRRDILYRLEYERIRSIRKKRKFSIILADIDHFKRVNDNYGHSCGDQVLKQLAHFIVASLRKQDVAGRIGGGIRESSYTTSRWGGEEFLILLPDTDQSGANVVAEKLRAGIQNQTFWFEDKELHITMSFGACECGLGEDLNKCISQADNKLYQAKNAGRNRVGE